MPTRSIEASQNLDSLLQRARFTRAAQRIAMFWRTA
jgi:hypothetical protein